MASNPRSILIAAFAGLALFGCGGQAMLDPDQKEPADGGLVSVLLTADPQFTRLLVDGFYPPEPFGRWTKPKFSGGPGVTGMRQRSRTPHCW